MSIGFYCPNNMQRIALSIAAVSLLTLGFNNDSHPTDATFRIIATDTGFIASTSIPAGMRHIVYVIQGNQIHEAMLAKLPEGMDANGYAKDVEAGISFPKGALDYSGPGLMSPGESTEVWLKLDPGRYLLICFNDHHVKSMGVHAFTVRNDVVNEPPPKENVVLKLADYRFDLEGSLKSGVQVIRVETPGPSMHEADLYRLFDGKTPDDLRKWRKEDESGVAPARALGGVLDNHDIKRVVWLRKTFSPGRYVLHCEMPMNDGKKSSHADVGMVREIDIRAST
jgi:hypothetical protein